MNLTRCIFLGRFFYFNIMDFDNMIPSDGINKKDNSSVFWVVGRYLIIETTAKPVPKLWMLVVQLQ